MPNAKPGQVWKILNSRGAVGVSTFTVIAVQGDYAIVQGEHRRKILLSTLAREHQYKLLKDANANGR